MKEIALIRYAFYEVHTKTSTVDIDSRPPLVIQLNVKCIVSHISNYLVCYCDFIVINQHVIGHTSNMLLVIYLACYW